jgi:hypothetical protein
MSEEFDIGARRFSGLIGFSVLMRRTWRVKLRMIRTTRISGRFAGRAERRTWLRSFAFVGGRVATRAFCQFNVKSFDEIGIARCWRS